MSTTLFAAFAAPPNPMPMSCPIRMPACSAPMATATMRTSEAGVVLP